MLFICTNNRLLGAVLLILVSWLAEFMILIYYVYAKIGPTPGAVLIMLLGRMLWELGAFGTPSCGSCC